MPVVAAAPELALALVVALMLVLLLVSVQLYQNGKQARSFAVGLPVISAPVLTAVDWLIGFNIQAARLVDTALGDLVLLSIQGFGRLVVLSFNAAGAVLLILIHSTAAAAQTAHALAVKLETVEVPALSARVGGLERALTADTAALKAFILASLSSAVAPVLARLGAAEGVIGAQQRVIDTYRPMWDQLAGVPGGAAAGIASLRAQVSVLSVQVAALEATLGQTQAGASALERQIAAQQSAVARLAAVGVIAGAGEVVIAEILRIAENPCEVCPGLNLNDLEGRVASMELAGV